MEAASTGERTGHVKGRRYTKSQTVSFRLTPSQVDILRRLNPAIGDSIHERARFVLIQALLEWNRREAKA